MRPDSKLRQEPKVYRREGFALGFNRTPGCPSLSSSTPAFSSACWTFLKGENITLIFTVDKSDLDIQNSIVVNKNIFFKLHLRKDKLIMNITRTRRIPLTRMLIPCSLALLFAVPVFAQVGGGGSPFDSTLNALLSFAQGTFAKIAAILAVIFGGWQVLSGDGHGKRAIGGLVIGVGLMVYAAPLITWLFP